MLLALRTPRAADKLRRIAKEHLWILKRETRHIFTLYVKVLWLFVFTGYSLLCVCEMTVTKLVFVNAPSFLNMKNDKLNYKYASQRGKSSHKTSMVFNDGSFGCVVNSYLVLSYLHISSLEFRELELLLAGLRVGRAL